MRSMFAMDLPGVLIRPMHFSRWHKKTGQAPRFLQRFTCFDYAVGNMSTMTFLAKYALKVGM